MPLSRIAAEFAAEIRQHDWCDAPYRADRAGHSREMDKSKRSAKFLSQQETEILRMNVTWVTAQVLGHADPNFDVVEFAAACGVDAPRGWIESGVRRVDGVFQVPGTFDYPVPAYVPDYLG